MREIYLIVIVFVMSIFAGCQPETVSDGSSENNDFCIYSAEEVRIIGLTSFKAKSESSAEISAYVSLHDRFGSSLKGPGIFRFELYEYVPRTGGERIGKRLYSWPDIDLIDAYVNNIYWKDFLRAYNFTLETRISPEISKTYVLQVTCTTPAGKRLTDTYNLNEKKS